MQVVMNLVANAAESMPAGGEVSLQTRHDPVRGEAVLKVQDHGIGISEQDQARIFEPFYTTKSASRGIGLGLAVVYGIVEAHAGRIEVESGVGRGTIFSVRFPVRSAEVVSHAV
jgi:signal transduction histidine kinase